VLYCSFRIIVPNISLGCSFYCGLCPALNRALIFRHQ
jgi:hypothetical protein